MTHRSARRPATGWIGLGLALALGACGGGGGGGEDNPGGTASTVTLEPLLQRRLSLRTAADLGGVVPVDVNGKNEVLGSSTTTDGRSRATIWAAGTVRAASSTLCADANAEAMNCLHDGLRLNDDGQVLMSWSTLYDYGFALEKDGQALGGFASSQAQDLAADGTVLAALGPPEVNALLVSRNGQLERVAEIPEGGPPENTFYTPAALNGSGRAVGFVRVGVPINGGFQYAGPDAGYVYDRATKATRLLVGTAAKPGTQATDVNDAGVVVGKAFVKGDDTLSAIPMRWDAALTPQTLGCPDALGEALVLSASGVAGGACGLEATTRRATLWQGEQRVDLNTLLDPAAASAGWVLRRVKALNANGWIVAEATQGSGEAQAVLLVPVD